MMHHLVGSGYLFAASDPPRKNLSPPASRDQEAAAPLRVLIVEDEALVAMDMEAALAEDGFEILGIVDCESDAVAAADRLKPDIILMDITLRAGDGISAAKTILKRLGARIVFVSANSDPVTLAAAQQLKPAGFIRKPFVTGRLAAQLRNALAEKH